jgi:hypothetical protein
MDQGGTTDDNLQIQQIVGGPGTGQNLILWMDALASAAGSLAAEALASRCSSETVGTQGLN